MIHAKTSQWNEVIDELLEIGEDETFTFNELLDKKIAS